jgi:hypothetical protein
MKQFEFKLLIVYGAISFVLILSVTLGVLLSTSKDNSDLSKFFKSQIKPQKANVSFSTAWDTLEVRLNDANHFYVTEPESYELFLLDSDFKLETKRSLSLCNYCYYLEKVDSNKILCSNPYSPSVLEFDMEFNFKDKKDTCKYSTCSYYWMFYEASSSLVYLSDFWNKEISIFDEKSFDLKDSIKLNETPVSIAISKNKIFIGSINKIIKIDKNTKTIIQTYDKLCSNTNSYVYKFAIDSKENIAYPCSNDTRVFLINSAGEQKLEPLNFDTFVNSVKLDTKNQMIVTTHDSLHIFS